MAGVDPFSLDPFSSIVRLGLLCFMDPSTKIGICNNSITLFDPSLLSWLRRNYWSMLREGCSRHELFHLRVPITRAIVWYREKAPSVLEYASRGLKQLSELYEAHGNVKETLNAMIALLDERDSAEPEDLSNKPNLQRLRDAWSDDEVQAIAHLFCILEKKQSEYIVTTIDQFILGKEPVLLDIIREPTL